MSAPPAGAAALAGSFARLFLGLSGEWRLEKIFSDGSAFSGRAVFVPAGGNAYALTEEGVLALAGGNRLAASRAWTWYLARDGSLAIAYPADQGGTLYHSFKPQSGEGSWAGMASHSCAADLYEAAYAFAQDRITISHRVTGPRKDYRIEAVMRR